MEIVETLRTVLAHHRHSRQKNETMSSDAMQVETPSEPQPASDTSTISNPMPLRTYFHLMLNYPTTRSLLLFAFRRHLQDPDDITILLQILSDWFVQRRRITTETCRVPGPKDVKKTTEGVWIITERKNVKRKQKPEIVPSLEKACHSLPTKAYMVNLFLPDNKSHFNSARLFFHFPPVLQAVSSDIANNLVTDLPGNWFHACCAGPAWWSGTICCPSRENTQGIVDSEGREGKREKQGRLEAEEKGGWRRY